MPNSIIFNEKVKISCESPSVGPSTSIITDKYYNVRIETNVNRKEELLKIELSDPSDESFLFQKDISEAEFSSMKDEFGINKNFSEFGGVLAGLLEEKRVFLKMEVVTRSSGKVCKLNFSEKKDWRWIVVLTLQLPILTGDKFIEHLLMKLREFKEKSSRTEFVVSNLEKINEQTKRDMENVKIKYLSEIQSLKDQLSDSAKEIIVARSEYDLLKDDFNDAENLLAKKEVEVNKLYDEIARLETNLDDEKDRADRMQEDDDERYANLKEMYDNLIVSSNEDKKMAIKFSKYSEDLNKTIKKLRLKIDENEEKLAAKEKENNDIREQLEEEKQKYNLLETRARSSEEALKLQNIQIKPIERKDSSKENTVEEKESNPNFLKPLPKVDYKTVSVNSPAKNMGTLGYIAKNSALLNRNTKQHPKRQ